jgi:hypothetical protein
MKRLDKLLATVLETISKHVNDFGLNANEINTSIFISDKFDFYVDFIVSIEYETLDETHGGVEAIKSITLNSAHVNRLTTDLQSDLPNVRKLLNEKLINHENKNLPL